MTDISMKLLNTPEFVAIIQDVRRASATLGIEFFGIGALARNVWYVSNDLPARGTKDIDFGVYVKNEETFERLKRKLLDSLGYKRVPDNPFCLISPYRQIPVDLIPFGKVKYQNKQVTESKGLIEINSEGLPEVYAKGLVETKFEDQSLKVCSIPAMVLLKLIAYDDRPEYRPKDPTDIASIFEHYPDIEKDLIWDTYYELYDDKKEHLEVGVMVLGCEVGKIIHTNIRLKKRVTDILEKAINSHSQLAQRMIMRPEAETVEDWQKLLAIFKDGINTSLSDIGQAQ